MREIKFRAWNPNDKNMDYNVDIIDGKYTIIDKWGSIYGIYSTAILMQYTGLKDKNGKEIYEGDIIRESWEDFRGNPQPYNFEVEFGENSDKYGTIFWHGWNLTTENDDIRQPNRDTYENGEVIGNIYENPELLDELDN